VPEHNSTTDDLSDVDAPHGVPPFAEVERPRATVREGLPSTYRMRADSHYIDHLESRQPAGPDAWLDPQAIESPPHGDDTTLGELVESIKRHGILQPLLVQHREGEYRLISGNKRRRAAIIAGIRRVPCVVHKVDDDEAKALASAANLRIATQQQPLTATQPALDTTSDVARALETLTVYANLLSTGSSELSRGLSADLIAAESWRAYCVVETTRIALRGCMGSRKLVMPRNVLDRVSRSFAPEFRLRNVAMEVEAQLHDDRMVLADEPLLTVALSGAVLATLALFDRNDRGLIKLSASTSPAGHLSFVIGQTTISVAETWASRAFDQDWTDRPGGVSVLASMLAIRRIAEAFGANITAASVRRGTSITLTMSTV
jgi:hypothetical protein